MKLRKRITAFAVAAVLAFAPLSYLPAENDGVAVAKAAESDKEWFESFDSKYVFRKGE